MKETNRKYFYGIDFLRWVAAFGVVMYHYSLHFKINEIDYNSFLNYLVINKEFAPKFVWLFWSISGFVFANIYLSQKIGMKKFFIARFARLYPLHFCTLLIVAVLQIFSLILFNRTQENYNNDLYHFILHLLFASDWGLQKDWSFNTPVWSVSIEIPIYFLFFITLIYLRKYKFLFPILIILFFYYVCPFIIDIFKAQNIIELNKWQNLAIFNFSTCIFYFFLGVFLFVFLNKYSLFNKYLFLLSLPLILMSILLLNSNNENLIFIKKIYPSTVVLFSSLIIFFATIDQIFSKFFKLIISFSNTSYSIYLLHFPIQLIFLIIFEIYLVDLEIFKNFIIFLIFVIILQIISLISFKFFEQPFRKYINKNLN